MFHVIIEALGLAAKGAGKSRINSSGMSNFVKRKTTLDSSGKLTFEQFEALTYTLKHLERGVEVETDLIFSLFDTNCDNMIDRDEVGKMCVFSKKAKTGIIFLGTVELFSWKKSSTIGRFFTHFFFFQNLSTLNFYANFNSRPNFRYF